MVTKEFLDEFGDPGLNLIIKRMREAREEFEREEAEDQRETVDEDHRLDDPRRGQAAILNRRYG